MKRVLAVALLAIAACSHKPAVSPCSQLTGCAASPSVLHYAGLDANFTVQRMLNSTLINGRPADPTAWPVSVYASSSQGSCSATVVGERVLFIASHCAQDGGKVTFSVGANKYSAKCSQHPEYRNDATADWELCLIDRPVTGPVYEVLGVNESLKIGDEVLLTGYGCVRPGGGGGNDGIFRIGEAKVQGLPSGNSYDVVTHGGAALCFGDSGGAAYKRYPDGRRRIFGVNSRGDIRTESYLPAVWAKTFKDWALKWAAANNNVRICGIHPDAQACRDGSQPPPPPPPVDGSFEVNAKSACVKGVVQPDYLSRKPEVVNSVKEALESL